jgi:hypothetical protein
LSLGVAWKGGISPVKASPDIYQGDLILTENNVTTIEGLLDINGSIIVKENATLVLKNAIVNFTQAEDWKFGLFLRDPSNGNPHLQVENTTITSNHRFSVELDQNSSAIVHDSQFTPPLGSYCWLWTYDSSTASFHNFTVYGLSSTSSSDVLICNSTIVILNIYGPCAASIRNSTIHTANGYGSSLISMDKSAVTNVQAFDSTMFQISDSAIYSIYGDNKTAIWLTNSTCDVSTINNQSMVFERWYLDVHVVDLIGQDVSSATVSARYPNSTVAESEFTNPSGWARLTLMEKMKNATGEFPVGNYNMTAVHEGHSGSTTINMSGNKQIFLSLNFVVPEFPSFSILILVVVTSLAVIIHKRKHSR